MSQGINWCVFCQSNWDDAHWAYRGDTGLPAYPDGLCEIEYRKLWSKKYRREIKRIIKALTS